MILQNISGVDLHVPCIQEQSFYDKLENYEKAKVWLKEIFTGLMYMHSLGVAHLDVKLDNILIKKGAEKTAVLADFSLIKDQLIDDSFPFISTYAPAEISHIWGDDEYLELFDPKKCDVWQAGILTIDLLFAELITKSGAKRIKDNINLLKDNKDYISSLYSKIWTNFKAAGRDNEGAILKSMLVKMLEIKPFKRPASSALILHDFFQDRKGFVSRR